MKKYLSIVFLTLVIAACNSAPETFLVRNHGPAQGTTYNISYVVDSQVDYRSQIDSILFVIDNSMSLWDKQSTISKLNNGDTVLLDKHFIKVLKKAIDISKKTNGDFDITVAQLANYWGFGPDEKGKIDSLEIDSLLQLTGYKKLGNVIGNGYLPKGMKIDLNAIAQGYSVDVISEFLTSKGISNFLVEVGGELRTSGKTIDGRIWQIGIDKPSLTLEESEKRYQVIVALDSMSLATSGNYRKFWVDEETGEKFVHTINPKTGYPVKSNLISATIIARTAIEADAFATACMVVGIDKAKELIAVNKTLQAYFIFIDKNGKWEFWQTPGFEKMVK